MSERPAETSDHLHVVPSTIKAARIFVGHHHRHHRAPVGALFALAVARGDEVVGVAMVGRPSARMDQDGRTAEVTRLCVMDDQRNACSMLYAAAWRAARALGWRRLITFILDSEAGTTLRAAGWHCIGSAGGGSWSRPSRPRSDVAPIQRKLRWQADLPEGTA